MIFGLTVDIVIDVNEDVCADDDLHHEIVDYAGLDASFTSLVLKAPDDNPLDVAGRIAHTLAASSFFAEGNARTGWLAARLFLQAAGYDFSVDPVHAETFVRTLAGDRSYGWRDASGWFEAAISDSRPGYAHDARFEYAMLAIGAEALDNGTLDIRRGHVHGATLADLPTPVNLRFVSRIHLHPSDALKPRQLVFDVEPDDGVLAKVEPSTMWTFVLDPPAIGGHAHHRHGVLPVIFAQVLPMSAVQYGTAHVTVSLDDKEVARIPFVVSKPLF